MKITFMKRFMKGSVTISLFTSSNGKLSENKRCCNRALLNDLIFKLLINKYYEVLTQARL